MAWIKLQQELAKHPKTKRLARTLGISKAETIGHLFLFWGWALDYADNGDISKFDAQDIADAAEWEGDPEAFLTAMTDCGPGDTAGFIERRDGGIFVHDWEEYMGRLLERRKQEALRLQEYRAKKKEAEQVRTDSVHSTNAACTEGVLGKSRVEKSRVENTTPPTPPSQGGGPVAGETPQPSEEKKPESTAQFEAFWAVYPRRVEKKPALKAWKAAVKGGAKPEDVTKAAETYGKITAYQHTPPDKIKHPATFLHEDRWKDWLPPDGAAYLEARNAAQRAQQVQQTQRRKEEPPAPATWEEAVARLKQKIGVQREEGQGYAETRLAAVS